MPEDRLLKGVCRGKLVEQHPVGGHPSLELAKLARLVGTEEVAHDGDVRARSAVDERALVLLDGPRGRTVRRRSQAPAKERDKHVVVERDLPVDHVLSVIGAVGAHVPLPADDVEAHAESPAKALADALEHATEGLALLHQIHRRGEKHLYDANALHVPTRLPLVGNDVPPPRIVRRRGSRPHAGGRPAFGISVA